MKHYFCIFILWAFVIMSGCASGPTTFYVQGVGEAPVNPVDESLTLEPQGPSLPWKDEVIKMEAEADYSEEKQLSPGVRIASARLEARDNLHAQIKKRLAGLRATRELMLNEFAREHRSVLSAIDEQLAIGEIIYDRNKDEELIIANTSFALEPIASAVLESGGGFLPDSQKKPPTREELERQAIIQAQRDALKLARKDLQKSIFHMTGFGQEVNVSKPSARVALAQVLGSARPVESALTTEGNWRIVLETDINPLWEYIDEQKKR